MASRIPPANGVGIKQTTPQDKVTPVSVKKPDLLSRGSKSAGQLLTGITGSGLATTRLLATLLASPFFRTNRGRTAAAKFVSDPFKTDVRGMPAGKSIAEQATEIQVRQEARGKSPRAAGPVIAVGSQLAEGLGDPLNLLLAYGARLGRIPTKSVAEAFFGTGSKKTSPDVDEMKRTAASVRGDFDTTEKLHGPAGVPSSIQDVKNLEKAAASDPAFAAMNPYQPGTNFLKPELAVGRIRDVATKLEAHRPGLGETLMRTLDPKKLTAEKLQEYAYELADGAARFTRRPEAIPSAVVNPARGELEATLRATVSGAKEIRPKLQSLIKETPRPEVIEPKVRGQINLNRLNISEEAKVNIRQTEESLKGSLEKIVGEPITLEDVRSIAPELEAATGGLSRKEQLIQLGRALQRRQQLAALSVDSSRVGEFVDALKGDIASSSFNARMTSARRIVANPKSPSPKEALFRKILNNGATKEEIVKAAEGVNFSNSVEATKFYRTFVKPSMSELYQEYTYINLLSSPQTHEVNLNTNLLQAFILKPAQVFASGSVDWVGSKLTGKQQQRYVAEVAPYVRKAVASIPQGLQEGISVLIGRSPITAPDLDRIPTNFPILRNFQFFLRALEAGDRTVRKMISSGLEESLAVRYGRQGKTLNAENLADIVKIAQKEADQLLFRAKSDPKNKTGQGAFNSMIDTISSGLVSMRSRAPVLRPFVPFIQTLTQIFKQGIELSPGLGLVNLFKNSAKIDLIGKQLVGGIVLATIASLQANGKIKLTWSLPTGEKERKAFFSAGYQPYALEYSAGGKKYQIQYSRLGPLAYPIAMVAAVNWYYNEKPSSIVKSREAKLLEALSSTAQFFTDQTAIRGVDNLINFISGAPEAATDLVTNVPRQLIPLTSLQGWVNRIIDPIYRKPEAGFSVRSAIQSLEKNIIGLSKRVPPATDILGRPSRRQLPILNAVLPTAVSRVDERFEPVLKYIRTQSRLGAIKRAISDIQSSSLTDAEKQKRLQELLKRLRLNPSLSKVEAQTTSTGSRVPEPN